MYKIFSDVDGTIYGLKPIITKELKKDVLYAKSKGYEFIIVTGNPLFSKMEWLMKELDVNYLIASNGAGIYDKHNNKYIYTSFISGKKINKIMTLAKKHGLFCDYWDKTNIYVSTFSDHEHFHALMNATLLKNYSNLVVLSNENDITPAFKIEVYGNTKNTAKFYEDLKKINLNLQLAFMNENHIEITNADVNKASGIRILLKGKNISIKDCMAIGDSANDESMLIASNYSYAMGNSPDNIKKIAKFQTKDFNNNGLGLAIRDYILKTTF